MITLPTFSAREFISNNAVGAVLAMILRRTKYNRARLNPANPADLPMPFYDYNVFKLSAIQQEVYQMQSEITNHAVETGVMFSDHVLLRPFRFELVFEVSNFDKVQGFGPGMNDRAVYPAAESSLEEVLKIWRGREPFTLLTTHRSFENMVCIGVQAENNVPEWGKLAYRVTLQQASFVGLEYNDYPEDKLIGKTGNVRTAVSEPKTPKSAVKKKKLGKKPKITYEAFKDMWATPRIN